MPEAKPEILPPDKPGHERAASLLRAGKLVAFATETVYGLGADAMNATAVASIYAAKGRPSFNPLIVHVCGLDAAARLVEISPLATKLADAFWPGPMTLVLPLRSGAGIPGIVTAGLETLAIRVPAAPAARDLLATFGGPVAAPSANPSGKLSPTTARHVVDGLGGRIAAVVDGGTCAVGLESTILRPLDGKIYELRPGGVTPEDVRRATGLEVLTLADTDATSDTVAPTSPGQLLSHYAPGAPVRLNASEPKGAEVWLGFGPDSAGCDINLSATGDLREAAANLFEALHQIDNIATTRAASGIAVSPIPDLGLGRAINDRLKRAAAPRGAS